MLGRLLEGTTLTERVLWGAGLFGASSLLSLVAVTVVLVALPVDYFREGVAPVPWPRTRALRWVWKIVKNILGVSLIALGLLMTLPGVPGQGILTMVIGLILLDFPGKHRVERRLVARPAVLGAINRVRARFHRPPMEL